MIDRADRLRVATGSEARHLVEREFRAGGDNNVIIGERAAVNEFKPVLGGMQSLSSLLHERDAVLLYQRPEVDGDARFRAPADADPRVRRRELEVGSVGDESNSMRGAESLSQLVSR